MGLCHLRCCQEPGFERYSLSMYVQNNIIGATDKDDGCSVRMIDLLAEGWLEGGVSEAMVNPVQFGY